MARARVKATGICAHHRAFRKTWPGCAAGCGPRLPWFWHSLRHPNAAVPPRTRCRPRQRSRQRPPPAGQRPVLSVAVRRNHPSERRAGCGLCPDAGCRQRKPATRSFTSAPPRLPCSRVRATRRCRPPGLEAGAVRLAGGQPLRAANPDRAEPPR